MSAYHFHAPESSERQQRLFLDPFRIDRLSLLWLMKKGANWVCLGEVPGMWTIVNGISRSPSHHIIQQHHLQTHQGNHAE